MIAVHRLRALKDNYVWLLVDETSGETAVVDPSEAAPVAAKLAELGLGLGAIWTTHHHFDHVGGIAELAARFPGARVYGSAYDRERARIPAQTDAVREGDQVPFAGRAARVLELPAHTLGHVAYLWRDRLFCGDTLFGGGCGRLFEGTPAQMQAALARLRALPDDTWVHCGHEYTWHNLRFAAALGLEPGNAALRARHDRVAADPAAPTVPTRLGEEKATNPFLRWDAPEIQRFAGTTDAVAAFAAVRAAKDAWRG